MKTSRRQLLVGLSGLSVVSLSGTVPMFVSNFARAAENPVSGTSVPNDNILVVIQMSGGNDGLNTVIPFTNDAYHNARKVIGIKQKDEPIKLNDDLYLNRGLKAMKEMYDQGQVAIINGCGYPEPNRSHFQSMAIWHTADPKGSGAHGGWLGHYLDHMVRGTNHLTAINIGSELPQALVSDGPPVASINGIDEFQVRTDPATMFDSDMEQKIIRDLNNVRDASPALKFLSRQATNAIISSEKIRDVTDKYKPDAEYQGPLGQQLKTIAQIIAGDFGTKVYYCQTGGFDTHSNQPGQQEQLLNQLAMGIQAFMKDLTAKKLANKVTIMCFSEFGRRIAQNDSNGTDHGTAGPMFVVGGKVKGGLFVRYPSLTDTDEGDLKYSTDFRRVYGTLLDSWLNADSTQVLGNKFEPLALYAGVKAGKDGGTENPTEKKEDVMMQMKS
jgi:uncharacterized protein (DUF1501 family)